MKTTVKFNVWDKGYKEDRNIVITTGEKFTVGKVEQSNNGYYILIRDKILKGGFWTLTELKNWARENSEHIHAIDNKRYMNRYKSN
jgi:hypothetical protein